VLRYSMHYIVVVLACLLELQGLALMYHQLVYHTLHWLAL
jgi:hypothetical protein